jgi:hypothetical protein
MVLGFHAPRHTYVQLGSQRVLQPMAPRLSARSIGYQEVRLRAATLTDAVLHDTSTTMRKAFKCRMDAMNLVWHMMLAVRRHAASICFARLLDMLMTSPRPNGLVHTAGH